MTADIRALPRPVAKRLSLSWVKDLPESSRGAIAKIARALSKDLCGLMERDIPILIELGRVLEEIRVADGFMAQASEAGDIEGWTRLGRKLDSSRRMMTNLMSELRQGHRSEILSMNEGANSEQAKAERLSASRWRGIL